MNLEGIISNVEKCRKMNCINEEETKMYLINPFIEFLGYNLTSPDEIRYEYVCDMHESGSRRIDYAIIDSNNEPKMLIEAKALDTDLSLHYGQLKTYFVSTKAKYAVITNGIEYSIFSSDQIDSNFVDSDPAYKLSINEIDASFFKVVSLIEKNRLKPYVLIKKEPVNKTNTVECVSKHQVNKKEIKRDVSEGIKSFISTNDLSNFSIEKAYSNYLQYCEEFMYFSSSKGKFEATVISDLSLSIKTFSGIKYFYNEDMLVNKSKDYVKNLKEELIDGKIVDEIYNEYKNQYTSDFICCLKKTDFQDIVIEIYSNYQVVIKSINGKNRNVFVKKGLRNIPDITKSKSKYKPISTPDFGYHQWTKKSKVTKESILLVPCDELYDNYFAYCETKEYDILDENSFSKKVIVDFNLNDEKQTIDNKQYYMRGDYTVSKSLMLYCKNTDSSNIIGRLVEDVYNDYTKYCKNLNMDVENKITFSKQVIRYYSVESKTKKINGTTKRIYKKV